MRAPESGPGAGEEGGRNECSIHFIGSMKYPEHLLFTNIGGGDGAGAFCPTSADAMFWSPSGRVGVRMSVALVVEGGNSGDGLRGVGGPTCPWSSIKSLVISCTLKPDKIVSSRQSA